MSDKTIGIRVTRFRPEQEDAPTEQVYEVPYQEDWVVLDALNYIKDHIDGTLSYPLVVPHGRVRLLRHDGQRRA